MHDAVRRAPLALLDDLHREEAVDRVGQRLVGERAADEDDGEDVDDRPCHDAGGQADQHEKRHAEQFQKCHGADAAEPPDDERGQQRRERGEDRRDAEHHSDHGGRRVKLPGEEDVEEGRRHPEREPRTTLDQRQHADGPDALEALPPASDVDRLPPFVDQVDRERREQHHGKDAEEARPQGPSVLGPEPEERAERHREQTRQEIPQAGPADRHEAADAEEVHALGGPTLLDHEGRPDDRVATLERSLDGRHHEERHGLVNENEPGRPEDVAGIGNQEDPAPPEEVREDPRGDDGETVGDPVDRGELRDEERVVPRGEQVEVEEESPDAHREPAERRPKDQEPRVPAESTDTTQVLAAAARLPDDENGDQDRQPDGDEPDGQGRVGALLRPVSKSAVAPGRRRECEEAHVSEATRGDPDPQGAPSSPTLTVSLSNL